MIGAFAHDIYIVLAVRILIGGVALLRRLVAGNHAVRANPCLCQRLLVSDPVIACDTVQQGGIAGLHRAYGHAKLVFCQAQAAGCGGGKGLPGGKLILQAENVPVGENGIRQHCAAGGADLHPVGAVPHLLHHLHGTGGSQRGVVPDGIVPNGTDHIYMAVLPLHPHPVIIRVIGEIRQAQSLGVEGILHSGTGNVHRQIQSAFQGEQQGQGHGKDPPGQESLPVEPDAAVVAEQGNGCRDQQQEEGCHTVPKGVRVAAYGVVPLGTQDHDGYGQSDQNPHHGISSPDVSPTLGRGRCRLGGEDLRYQAQTQQHGDIPVPEGIALVAARVPEQIHRLQQYRDQHEHIHPLGVGGDGCPALAEQEKQRHQADGGTHEQGDLVPDAFEHQSLPELLHGGAHSAGVHDL